MRVLAVDTTSNFGSLALLDGDIVIEEIALHSIDGFSPILFGHIAALLGRHGWTLSSIDLFAAASGPGSFTGVRVGLAAVKGLAEVSGKLCADVSNMKALASYGVGDRRAVILDARREEVYAAIYDSNLEALTAEAVRPFADWAASIGEVSCVISTDFSAYRDSFHQEVPIVERRSLAAAIGHIAVPSDVAGIDANYVRRSDAELFWVDK